METTTAKNAVMKCNRIKENIRCIVEQNSSVLTREFQKQIRKLEFYEKEEESKKKDLLEHVSSLKSIKSRIEQTQKSLQYPKEICTRCMEIRYYVRFDLNY